MAPVLGYPSFPHNTLLVFTLNYIHNFTWTMSPCEVSVCWKQLRGSYVTELHNHFKLSCIFNDLFGQFCWRNSYFLYPLLLRAERVVTIRALCPASLQEKTSITGQVIYTCKNSNTEKTLKTYVYKKKTKRKTSVETNFKVEAFLQSEHNIATW